MDLLTIERGTSAGVLMKRAGLAVSQALLRRFPNARDVVVLCGPGNNGGDGLVVAKELRGCGLCVRVVVTAADKYSEEFLLQLAEQSEVCVLDAGRTALFPPGVALRVISPEGLQVLLRRCDVVVDALLGTGQRSSPRQSIAEVIQRVEMARSQGARFQVVSVDVPTGVDADTGQLFTPHISADLTVCVQAIKRGLLQFPARAVCGAIESVSIGILEAEPCDFVALEGAALPVLGKRRADSHKGDFGRVVVVGGSLGMPGAPSLTALAALCAGAGTVSWVTKRSWCASFALAECMREVLSDDSDTFGPGDAEEVLSLLGRFDVVILGPGMGLTKGTGEFLSRLCDGIRVLGKRVVLDADAINQVSILGIDLRGLDGVITPHPGEASRMLGRPTPALQANRFNSVRELWQKYGVVAVLKGAGTLVYGDQGGRIVCCGTPYLATAGSGDVLAGIIGALCARCESAFDAASLGVWTHAVAGIRASEVTGGPILASDIARAASGVIGGLEA